MVKQYNVIWLLQARDNLSSIYRYIKEEQNEPNNANAVRDALLTASRTLSQFPEKHAKEPTLSFTGKPCCSIVVKSSFKLVYLVMNINFITTVFLPYYQSNITQSNTT